MLNVDYVVERKEVFGDGLVWLLRTVTNKACGYSMAVEKSKEYRARQGDRTIDERANLENSDRDKELNTDFSEEAGLPFKSHPNEELAKWCYVIRAFNQPLPTVEEQVSYLTQISGKVSASEKEIDGYVESVLNSFSSPEEARSFVIGKLAEEARRNQSEWERLGRTVTQQVKLEIETDSMYAGEMPYDFPNVVAERITKQIWFGDKFIPLSKWAGQRQELHAMLAHT